MFTHVIFDLDGTILNTLDDLADAGNHICAMHGWKEHPVEAYKKMVGNGISRLVSRFAPPEIEEDELEQARQEFMEYYDAHKADKTAAYAGVAEAIFTMRSAGVRVAVLTNKADKLARSIVEDYYPDVFDAVQGALPDRPAKPDPALLLELMRNLNAGPESTLFVGDSNVDIVTGKNAGLATCGVLWGFRSRAELEGEGADYIVKDPSELLQAVFATKVLSAHEHAAAARLLSEGKLVAVPTETVYGLASDATQEMAVQANYEAKGRPETKPLNVLVSGMDMVEQVCSDIPAEAYKLAKAFWPGPLTMILRGKGTLPSIVPAGGKTQGVRCPDHPDTLAVIRALGRPLACPSANLSGQPSPKCAGDVLRQLAGRIDAVLDGGACSVGVESTILDLTVAPYRILRQGGLSKAEIEAALEMEVVG